MADEELRAGQGGIVGVVLAGGLARRMGGADKALVAYDGRPLLAHAIERFRPQVDTLLISANGDPARFAAFGLEVVPDPIPGNPGPLAGIAAAALWARRHRPDLDRVASIAVDNPLLPVDLVPRLAAALAAAPSAGCAVAASGGRVHPVAALHPIDVVDELLPGLASGDIRRLMTWIERCRGEIVDFTLADEDPFTNFNTHEELAAHAARDGRGDPPKVR